MRLRLAAAIVGALLCACRQVSGGPRNPDAESRMAALLDASAITHLDSTATTPDSLTACRIESASDPYKALAWSRILTSSSRGDTVEVSAEIVTVAKLSQRVEGGYEMRLLVETDTLHWPMVRDSLTGKWGACGLPREGYDFMRMIVGPDTRWVPSSDSWTKVASLADSVRAARPK